MKCTLLFTKATQQFISLEMKDFQSILRQSFDQFGSCGFSIFLSLSMKCNFMSGFIFFALKMSGQKNLVILSASSDTEVKLCLFYPLTHVSV